MARPRYFAVIAAQALPVFEQQASAFDKAGYTISKLFGVPLVPLAGKADAEPTHYGCNYAPQYQEVWQRAQPLIDALKIEVIDGGTATESADFDAAMAKLGLKRREVFEE